ncbi:ferrous iron transport protein B [Candidatus Thorarchaeota archaeon]|nr:MAG: ferrous iron transport protein B [Candidatus Thorarchaeota archaeon]
MKSFEDLDVEEALEEPSDYVDPQLILADQRYEIIGDILCEVYEPGEEKWNISDLLDEVFLHRYLGIPVFLVVMWTMFHFTFQVSLVFMAMIEAVFAWISTYTSQIPIPWLASLVTDGVVGGVGFILTFIPPIFLLYLAISVLEDTGYLARAAFVMDRWMTKMGLHGRSFIPLLLGFGCSVAAVLGSRTVEGRSNRLTTILIAPLMSCAGRLPVYVLIAGIFFPSMAGTVVFLLYILGIVMAVIIGFLLKHTALKDEISPLVMELPMYQMPTVHGSFRHMWERGVMFLKRAGTYLLIGSIIIWALSSFGPAGYGVPIADSFIGIMGRYVAPIFAPLGFEWQIVAALIFGLLAKEVVVQSLAIILAVEGQGAIQASLLALMSPVSAFALMVFVLLYIPCIATMAVIKSETGSWKWTIFSFVYQTFLAYFMALAVVSIGGFLFG